MTPDQKREIRERLDRADARIAKMRATLAAREARGVKTSDEIKSFLRDCERRNDRLALKVMQQ